MGTVTWVTVLLLSMQRKGQQRKNPRGMSTWVLSVSAEWQTQGKPWQPHTLHTSIYEHGKEAVE